MKHFLSLVLFLFAPTIFAANTITLNADLVSGSGSVSPTLTWSTAPVASSCTASGGWTGTKSSSGSEKIPAITTSKTFILSCTWNTGDVTLVWAAPTKNTDGTNLTDLAGFKIYRASGGGPESLLTTINSSTTLTFLDKALTPATYTYTMTAFSLATGESDHTNPAVITITAATNTQSIAITVNPKPMPPTGFTVQ